VHVKGTRDWKNGCGREKKVGLVMLGGFKATGGVTTVKSHVDSVSKKTHGNTLGGDYPTAKVTVN
jgi:hypothetical protein